MAYFQRAKKMEATSFDTDSFHLFFSGNREETRTLKAQAAGSSPVLTNFATLAHGIKHLVQRAVK